MAQAGTVVTKSVVIAIFWAGHQTAVMPGPTRVTAACSGLALTLSVIEAVVGAFLFRAILTTVIWVAIASAIETLAVWLIAATFALLHTAVCAGPIFITMTLFAEFITDTIAIAVVEAQICLGLALKANKPSRAQTVAVTALATIRRTISFAGLLAAGGAFPANLAKTGGIITTVSILAVRTDGLRTVITTIADIALATSSHTIATTMARAAVRAHLHLTRLSHEARGTHARAVDTSAMH